MFSQLRVFDLYTAKLEDDCELILGSIGRGLISISQYL
jgi:hypothetical protein